MDTTPNETDPRILVAKEILDGHATLSLAMVRDGEPWAAKAFFVEDEPDSGRFDVCCALLLTAKNRASLEESPRAAFVVGGDTPDRWIQGIGSAVIVDDEADAAATLKRLIEKSPSAGAFLGNRDPVAVRINVDRLTVTDLSADPPVCEFTFA